MRPNFSNLEKRIVRHFEYYRLPSVAVGISINGSTEFSFFSGKARDGIQTNASTPYSLASITKPFISTLLALFADRGQLDLSSAANDYLSTEKLKSDDAQQATLARLANHTSGLGTHYQFFFDDETLRPPDVDETLRRYGSLVYPIGERYQYSNLGYGILGSILPSVGNASLKDLIKHEICGPLGLSNSIFEPDANELLRCASRYDGDLRALAHYVTDHPGASEMYASVDDLLKFGNWHLGLASGGSLSRSAKEKMRAPLYNDASSAGYGLGWRFHQTATGDRICAHSGGMAGVNTWLALLPWINAAIVILSNRASGGPDAILKEIYAALNVQVANITPDVTPIYAHDELVGCWKGTIATFDGDVDIALGLSPDGDSASLGGDEKLCELEYPGNTVIGKIDGEIPSVDTTKPHNIEVDLVNRGDTLYGAATAKTLPGLRAQNAVTFPARLTRVA